jgi:hypothetical protein
MKRAFLFAWLSVSALFLLPLPGHADDAQLSPDRLDLLDERGYFTPAFKAAVHDLVDNKKALEQAQADVTLFTAQLPDLQKQSAATQAKTDALRRELAKYQHPEDDDYAALQAVMKNPSAKPEEQLALAQAFVWAYPTNPHADEARQDLLDTQKKIADQAEAEKEAEAAQAAKEVALLERVQARSLSLNEWKDFLRDKSQEDLLKYLGRPDVVQSDYWTYNSAFTVDPNTGQKVGLLIAFNGLRVNSVAAGPNVP